MNPKVNTDLEQALQELLDYYPSKREFLIALDEILYALFCIDSDDSMMLHRDIHNCAFTIRKLKNVILADQSQMLTIQFCE